MHAASVERGRRGTLLGLGGALLGAAAPAPAASASAVRVQEVAPGVFVLPGVHEDASPANDNAIANVGFVVGGASVAVVDPGGSIRHGQRLRRAVEAATPLPIRHLVLTHAHPDHVMGAAAFADLRPEVVGHARLPEALAQRRDGYLRMMEREMGAEAAAGSDALPPTRLVEDRLDLDLGGGRVLAVSAHGLAHTDADLSLFDAATSTLWLSDLLFVERIPSLDGSLLGWLREVAALRDRPAARAVPGHGPPSVPWPEAAAALTGYLEALRDGTRAAVASGLGIAEAPSRVALAQASRWRLAEAYHGRNVSAAYRELEWE
ncbi:MAG: quinoprotein relay system zinc metallohydrolase 2 [Acetobacteraceae bacterium]|nr:quinoprotein relay system zinc metallohydrolase 2 [Acetobacteraceae bacterium]